MIRYKSGSLITILAFGNKVFIDRNKTKDESQEDISQQIREVLCHQIRLKVQFMSHEILSEKYLCYSNLLVA